MKKLTFNEYLSSKQKLRESVETTSHCSATYNIIKYCRLPITDKNNKTVISLKPKQSIIIDWYYPTTSKSPVPISVIFENIDIHDEPINTSLSGTKLLKWLNKNAIQKLY